MVSKCAQHTLSIATVFSKEYTINIMGSLVWPTVALNTYIALNALDLIQWSEGHHRPRNPVDISTSYKVKKDHTTREAQGVSSLVLLPMRMNRGIHKSHVIQPCHSANSSFCQ